MTGVTNIANDFFGGELIEHVKAWQESRDQPFTGYDGLDEIPLFVFPAITKYPNFSCLLCLPDT